MYSAVADIELNLSINFSFCISRKKASAFIQMIPCANYFLLKGDSVPLSPPLYLQLFKTRKLTVPLGVKGLYPLPKILSNAQTCILNSIIANDFKKILQQLFAFGFKKAPVNLRAVTAGQGKKIRHRAAAPGPVVLRAVNYSIDVSI